MKTLASWAILAAVLLLAACTPDDDFSPASANGTINFRNTGFSPCNPYVRLTPDDLPAAILDYVAANYTNYTLSSVRRYQSPDGIQFGLEVEISGPNDELLFDANGVLLSSGQEVSSQDVAFANLPATAQAYVTNMYGANTVEEIELETDYGLTYYDLELFNSTDLYFTTAGVLLCVDDDDHGGSHDDDDDDDWDDHGNSGGDDDDDDDNISVSSLPQAVIDYLNANYPGFLIDEAHRDDLCGDVPVLEVELEVPGPDPDLYFDLAGNFLLVEYDIAFSDLPAPVAAVIATEYPGFVVVGDDLSRQTLANGSVQYEVKLRLAATGQRVELVIAPDGTILCRDESGSSGGGGGNDDDDDDDDDDNNNSIDLSTLPVGIGAYVTANYPNAYVDEFERERLCDGSQVYEVGLENTGRHGHYLFFSLSGDYLYTQWRVSAASLPAAVSQAVASQFANYEVDSDDISRQEWPNGEIRYEFELEPNDDDDEDIVAIFAPDGTLLCSYED